MKIGKLQCRKTSMCSNKRCIIKLRSMFDIKPNSDLTEVLRIVNEPFAEVPSIYLTKDFKLNCKNFIL